MSDVDIRLLRANISFPFLFTILFFGVTNFKADGIRRYTRNTFGLISNTKVANAILIAIIKIIIIIDLALFPRSLF